MWPRVTGVPKISSVVNLLCDLAGLLPWLRPSSILVAEDGHSAPLPIRVREPGFWKEQPVTSRE